MIDKSSSPGLPHAFVALLLGLACLCAVACSHPNAGPDSSTAPGANTAPDSSTAPGANTAPDSSARPEDASCARFDAASVLGTVDAPEITEASGLVASRRQPGVLWTHNDSGHSAAIFALAKNGSLLATYSLDVRSNDWEDIALGPGLEDGLDYLYIGDIGDNLSKRASVTVYRIAEPRVQDGGGTIDASEIVSFELRYPDGPHDAETLLSDPRTGDLYIVTKTLFAPGPTQLFRYSAEAQAAGAGTLEALGALDLGAADVVTAGDMAADGAQILLRGYQSAQLWHRAPGQSVAEALAQHGCEVPTLGFPEEPKGESIAFDSDGRDYFTLSEGRLAPVYRFRRLE
jgi:hypothetical protein